MQTAQDKLAKLLKQEHRLLDEQLTFCRKLEEDEKEGKPLSHTEQWLVGLIYDEVFET